jgi:hypothetical protein
VEEKSDVYRAFGAVLMEILVVHEVVQRLD